LAVNPGLAFARACQLAFGRNRGLAEMTANSQGHGKMFHTGVCLFGSGLVWFHSSPGGIFTLQPLNVFDALRRAEILIGAMLAAYGILVWRSAFHKLSRANYIIVLSCLSVLLLYASKMSQWLYFARKARGPILNELELYLIQIAVVVCLLVFGMWWADRAYARERFHSIRADIAGAGLRSISDQLSLRGDGSDEILQVSACRKKDGWNPPRTVRYEDTYYRLESASLGHRPRPFEYTLRRLPAGVPGPRVIWYTPVDVVLRKER